MALEKRIVLYTCITGGYDELLEPAVVDPSVDYTCVSDKQPPAGSIWGYLPLPCDFGDAAANSRYVKMHPHLLFPQHDINIYVDASIHVLAPVSQLALKAMQHASIALYQHNYRNCAYREALECSAIGYDWHWRISKQMNRYRKEGFPSDWGLFEAGVIIRANNMPKVSRLMELWWKEYISGVRRDQLSLTYLAWKTSTIPYNLGPSDFRKMRSVFSLQTIHSRQPLLTVIRGIINRRILSLGFT